MCSSDLFSVRQLRDKENNTVLIIESKKARIGQVGQTYMYKWDIDIGKFEWLSSVVLPDSGEDSKPKRRPKEEPTAGRKKKTRGDDVF